MIQNTMLSTQQTLNTTTQLSQSQTPSQVTKAFGEYLQNALQEIDTQEQQVHTMNTQMMLGEVNVDELMIASERALLNLQLTTNIRNKVVEAYQEIMRMQM